MLRLTKEEFDSIANVFIMLAEQYVKDEKSGNGNKEESAK
jgi:hypothetical protein